MEKYDELKTKLSKLIEKNAVHKKLENEKKEIIGIIKNRIVELHEMVDEIQEKTNEIEMMLTNLEYIDEEDQQIDLCP